MTRDIARLEVDFTSVDINNSYATHSKLSNKSQIPFTAEENNFPPTQASNKNHAVEAATPLNLHLPLRDIIELITLSDAGQNSTRMLCYFHCLWNCFMDYFDDTAQMVHLSMQVLLHPNTMTKKHIYRIFSNHHVWLKPHLPYPDDVSASYQ